jgi:hypothetical protein
MSDRWTLLDTIEVPTSSLLELSPPAGAHISGRIMTPDVSGPGFGVVWLMSSPHQLHLRSVNDFITRTQVSDDGSYQLEASPGIYDLVFYSFNHQIGQVVEGVELSTVIEHDFVVPNPTVRHRLWGQVFDHEGILGSFMLMQFYSTQDNLLVQVGGNQHGLYTVELPAATYAVTANAWIGIGRTPAIALGTIDITGDRQHDFRTTPTVVAEAPTLPLPGRIELEQNYPNPFNSTTSVRFVLASEGEATLAVYNLLGQKVRTLAKGRLLAGASVITWDGRDDHGRDLATGVYVYRLEIGSQVLAKKLLMLK